MTTARDIMTPDVQTLREDGSLTDAARLMAEHGVGALPVISVDGILSGIITDRDIVVGAAALGRDLSTTLVGGLAHGIVSTVGADEDIDRIVDIMGDQQIKRLPVLEGDQLVGMISESDLARSVDEDKLAHFVKMVYGRD